MCDEEKKKNKYLYIDSINKINKKQEYFPFTDKLLTKIERNLSRGNNYNISLKTKLSLLFLSQWTDGGKKIEI